MTSNATTMFTSGGTRIPRVCRGMNLQNHNSTRVRFGLRLNNSRQVRGRGLQLNHNTARVCVSTVR